MAKGYSGRGRGSSRGGSGQAGGSSSRSSSNSRMWSQPATSRQISALKAKGNYDGKYYSKGRAGQTIGESVRASSSAAPAPKPRSGRSRAGRGQQPAHSSAPLTGPLTISLVDPAPLRGEIVPAPPPPSDAQLVATPNPSPSAEQQSGSGGFFALFDELEERHLTAFRSKHYSHWGDDLRDEIEAWADLRIKLAKKLVDAHAELVAILGDAPAGAIPDPAATARQLLDAASPHGHEEQHLRSFLSKHYSHWGDDLRDEVKDWIKLRIRLAKTNARELVDMLNQARVSPPTTQLTALTAAPGQEASKPTQRRGQPARPKTPRTRTARTDRSGKGRTYSATVERINPSGAVVLLDSGEQGWLHVSKLRVLNGGSWVESVSDVLELGQEVHTRGIGTTDRGQVQLTLVDAGAVKRGVSDAPGVPTESSDDGTPPAAGARRGLLKWFASVRSGRAKS